MVNLEVSVIDSNGVALRHFELDTSVDDQRRDQYVVTL